MASLGLKAQTIPNASFESPGTFTNYPGYSASNGNADITGWTMNNRSQIGLNTVSGPFLNYGTSVPDGTWAAFVQSSNSASNTLSTTITGLTVGVTYSVTFSAGQRAGYATPASTWSLNGGSDVSFTVTSGVWTTFSGTFTATSTTAALSINNTTSSDSALLLDNFQITVPVTVTSVSPSSGTTAGGTSVTITGTGFTGATGVTIGGTAATSVSVVNDTTITCTTPAHAAGSASVLVTTPYGTNAANTLFTYYDLVASYSTGTEVPVSSSGYTATGKTVGLSLNFAPTPGTELRVVTNTAARGFITGQFSNLTQGQVVYLSYGGNTYKYVANYYGGTGNDLVLVWGKTRLYSWGNNFGGVLGNGDSSTSWYAPTAVLSNSSVNGKTVFATAAGANHSLALLSDGTVVAWGSNSSNQLGDGTTNNRYFPGPVTVTGTALAGKTVIAIAAGETHSLALCSDGTMAAWGSNSAGQLGDNSATNRSTAVAVQFTGALSGKTVVQIGAGLNFSQVLCSDGTVVSWGSNGNGQFGTGSSTSSQLVPVAMTQTGVLNGKSVISIAPGRIHTLVVCADGTAAGSGYNYDGQMGNGSSGSDTLSPVLVSTSGVLSGKTIAAGSSVYSTGGVICSDGTVATWGYNGNSQLGNNTSTNSTSPVLVSTASGVSSLFGKTPVKLMLTGSRGLVQCSDGTYHCWGGSAGDNTTNTRAAPVALYLGNLAANEKIVSAAGGPTASNYLAIVGAPQTAGISVLGNSVAISNGSAATSTANFTSFGGLAAGSAGTVTRTFTISSTGENPLNLSGTPKVALSGTDAADFSVTAQPSVSQIAAGGTATFQVTYTAAAVAKTSVATLSIASDDPNNATFSFSISGYATGSFTANFNAATDVPLSASLFTAAGSTLTTTLNFAPPAGTNLTVINNTGRSFISGEFSNMANGSTVNLTYNSVTYPFIAWYYGGDGNDLVLLWPYTGLAAWGYNGSGQIGDNSTTNRLAPALVDRSLLGGKTIVQVARGSNHTLALTSDGKVYAWGSNGTGQLGDNTTTQRNIPVQVNTASGTSSLFGKTVARISAGNNHSVAVCTDGSVVAWGYNSSGQLGDNTTTQRSAPVLVNTTSGTSALYGKSTVTVECGGGDSTLALCSDGSVVAWGLNNNGQLGDNSTTNRSAPVAVNTTSGTSALFGKTVARICMGYSHSLALCSDGTVVAWGYNGGGQLGDNTTTQHAAPVLVNTASGTSALFGKTVTSVMAGDSHSLALCSDGTVAAWGYNGNGQLGDNSTTQRNAPVAVNKASGTSALFGKTVVALAGGAQMSQALCSDGTVTSWGYNNYGEIGDNSTSNRSVPVLVNTTSGISALSGVSVMALSSAGASSNHSAAVFTWSGAPVLSSISPTSGFTVGGTSVTLSGYGFTGATGVTFNGVAATSVTVVNDATITCTTPAGSAGTASVVVTTPQGSNSANTLYTYVVPVPTVTGISPNAGTTLGGANVTITGTNFTGTNFTGTATVTIGGAAATNVSVVSSTSITCTTPAGTAGSASVLVTTNYGTNSANSLYTYYAPPTVTSISPNTGSTLGGNSVTITGTNFTGATSVTIGGFSVSGMSVLNATTITCTAPSGSSGTASVLVTTPGGTSSANTLYTYGPSPTLSSVSPNNGSTAGGSTVTITGTNFTGATGVTFGGTAATGVSVVSSTSITCTVPARSAGTISVVVTTPYGSNPGNIAYTYVTVPTVTAISPNNGSTLGGASVTISGSSFVGVTGVTIGGVAATSVNATSATSLTCVTPAHAAGSASVLVTNGYGTNSANTLYTYSAPARIYSWGGGYAGNLGNNNSNTSNVPVSVYTAGALAGKTVTAVSTPPSDGFMYAFKTLALTADGKVYSWGPDYGGIGSGGDGTTSTTYAPTAVNMTGMLSGKTVTAIAAGNAFGMALTSDGKVYTWGNGGNGSLGNNTGSSSTVPVAVDMTGVLSGKTVTAIAAGAAHALALTSDGKVYAWGFNGYGQLGNTNTNSAFAPVAVYSSSSMLGKTITKIAAGAYHSMAVDSTGQIHAWGRGDSCQLGNGGSSNSVVPVAVTTSGALSGKTITKVAGGTYHSMALDSAGKAYTWGYGFHGQLGLGPSDPYSAVATPTAVYATAGFLAGKTLTDIAGGYTHTLAVDSTGKVYAWGYNDGAGSLGNGGVASGANPYPVVANGVLAGQVVTSVSAGYDANYGYGTTYAVAALPPTLLSVLPATGTVTGGTKITITGTELYGATSVTVGGVAATNVTSVGSNMVTAITGPHTAGSVDVVVTTPGGSATATGAFTYGPLLGAAGGTWTQRTSAGTATWQSIASSADGTKLLAAANGGQLYTSTDSGVTWTARDSSRSWTGVASSANGTNLVAVVNAGQIYTSTDSGATWTARASSLAYNAVASSADGTSLVATVNGGQIYTSADSGLTWTARDSSRAWRGVASSADGSRLVACVSSGQIYTSTDFGVTWFARDSSRAWTSVASSADGSKLLASVASGGLYVSSNAGVTWTATSASSLNWSACASSADGAKLAAAVNGDKIYTSSDSGTTWTAVASTQNWLSIASSADGSSLAAGASAGSVWTSQGGVTPTVQSISPSRGVIAGSVSVTITGNSFTSATGVTIGGAAATNISVVNDTTLTCTTPAGTEGTASVVVTIPSGSSAANALYTYYDPSPTATFASAATVPITSAAYDATGRTLNLALNYAPAQGTSLTLVNNTGASLINGTFGNLANGATVNLSYGGSTYSFVAWYYGGDGNDLVLMWPYSGLAAWGYNGYSQLGDTTTNNRLVPVDVVRTGVLSGKTIVQVVRGTSHVLALASDGSVYSWGLNTYGQLGDNSTTTRSVPVAVNTASGVSALFGKTVVRISAGDSHSLALCSDGTVVAWGYNVLGQLGDNTTTNRSVPVAVNAASGTSALFGKTVTRVSGGYYHSLALCSDGTVVAWGSNGNNQLGDGTQTSRSVPILVSTANGTSALYGKSVVALAAGSYHNLAACSDGTLVSWGYNSNGQLGDNSTTQRSTPVLVNMVSGTSSLFGKAVVGLAPGYYHNLVVCSDGTVSAWGYNPYGGLGDNTTTQRLVPVSVNTTTVLSGKTVVAAACGQFHSTALCSDGSVAAWGYNPYGELGNNTTTNSSLPVAVNTTSGTSALAGNPVIMLGLGTISEFNVVLYGVSGAPTVTSISPSSGSTAGGTSVTITGTGFTGATGVTIGGTAATGVTVVSATSITATTPAGTAGTASVVVTTPSGSNGANTLFTYLSPPVIDTPSSTSITASGATLGGNVASDGGDTISERGVVYSVTTANSNPTIGGGGVTKVIIAGTTGVFATGISGLTAGTGYSFKAYAINSIGTTYTTVSTFTTVTNTAPSFALQGQGVSALSPGGWWRAENNTADSSGNGNDGTAVNGVTYTSGPSGYGQAFHMNGSGQYISVPHSPSVSFSSSFTISAWVRVTDRNNFYFIATKQPSAGAGTNYPGNFEFRIPPSGNVELMYQTGSSSYQSFAATSQIPLNTWTHVAAVFSAGTSVSFYINGAAAGVNATGVTTLLTNTQPLLLGTRADNYTYFVGDLDEVSLFGSALSQSQVQGVYYSALSVAEDSGAYSASGFASGISAGSAAESGQTVSFALSNNNNALFSAQPAISTNGTLTFTPAPNANGSATVTVTAMDNGGTASGGVDTSAAQTFTITVTPVNDTPTDIGLTSTSIAENNAAGATVGTLSTTDVDVGDTFAYTLVSGTGSTDNASFSITGSTLTITPSADYETKNSYAIRVRSTDAGGLYFEKQFTISIINVNEAPTIAAAIANSADLLVYETVNPTRSGNNIVYSVNNAAALAATTFSRVRYRMELTVSGTPRYADTSFDAWSGLTVAGLKVPDGSTPIAIQRNVTNMTVDSNYPGVVNGSGQTGRLEIWPSNYSTGANGGVGGSSSTYDFDDSGFDTGLGYGSFQVHNLSSGPPQTVLAWNQHGSASPDIGFGNQPGGSGHPDWTFSNGSLGKAGWKLQISVSTPYTFALTEDVTGNLLFTGTPFADDSASLTVTLGVADGAITGNAGTGITVGGTALSRTFTGTVADLNTYFTTAGKITYLGALNNNTSRTLSIAISDGTYTANASSTITLAPVNDTPTDIALSATSIAENNAAGATVGTLSTTDVDTGDTFAYTLVSGTGSTDNASFSITGSTLKITPSADYETKNSYAIRVRTTDSGGLYFEKQFTISITNVNEAPTDIAGGAGAGAAPGVVVWGASTTFNNNPTQVLTNGTRHAAVTVTGGDLTVNGVVFDHYLGSGSFANSSNIAIDNNTGLYGSLASGGSGSYGQLVSYAHYVQNSPANITISGLTPGQVYQVQIWMPYWDNDYPANYSTAGGSAVLLHNGYGAHPNPDTVTGTFVASGTTQVITRSPTNTWAALAAVSVRSLGAVGMSIAENNATGSTVGTMSTTDPDAGSTFTYSLVSGTGSTDNASFSFSGANLIINAVADYETKSSYSIRVRSTDAGGLFFEKQFTVSVTNLNDAPTNIALTPSSIAENNTAGATVGALSTVDQDAGDTAAYTLVSGTGSTDNASFSITGSTLTIGVSANYEAKSSYSIRVRTTDSGGLFFEKQFTISITDVNETPVITSNGGGSTATISLAENIAAVTTVQATDPEVPSTQTLTFSKSGTDAALFTINSSTGALSFVNAPNYEVPVDAGEDNVYNVTVTVTDSAGSPLSDSQDLAITITDVVEVQNDVSHGWSMLYGGVSAPATRRNGDGKAVVVQQDSSGAAVAVFATGFTTNAAGNKDIYTVCYNPGSGAVVWEQIYNGSANGADEGSALAVDGNGDVIVTGYTTNSSGNWDVVTLKYAHADGAQLWKKTYAGAGGGADVGACVAVDASNNVAVAGYGTSSGTGMDVFGARYASDGSTIFETLVDGGGSSTDLASSLALDSSSNVIIGGYRTKSGAGKDLLVLKMAAATGASQWTWVINGSSNNDDFAYGVAVGAADAVFITGSVRNTNYDLYLAKLSSAGSAQWSTQWNSSYNSSDAGYALALDSNGNVVVAGTSYTAAGVQDGYVAKYRSSTGAMIWDYRYDSASHGNDILRSVAVDKENKVIATGYSQNSAGNYDVLTVKTLGVDGSGLWAQTYNGAANGNDEGRSVAMTATGQAYVAGYSTSASGTTDFFLTSYSAAVPGTQTPQTITFANPGTQSAGASLTLAASSDSGLTVRFAVISGPAQIDSSSNALLNFTGSGSVTVRATQSGSATYAAATPVDQTFTVNKSSQTINFTLPAVLSSTAQWPLTGVASSGLAVSYSVQSGPGSVSSGILSFSGAGSVTVRASQAGDARFDAATNVDAVVTVDSSSPVVILNNIAENWRDLYAGSGAGQGNDIALQLSGNDAVAGFVGGYTTTSTGKDMYLAKYLADGTLSWSSVSGTTGDDEAMAVAVDGSGNLYVAGYVTTGTGQDIYVAKYNGGTGARIWNYTYNGAGNSNDVAVSLDLEGSTNVVVGAYVVGSGTSNDFYAAKLNQSTGAVVWTSVQNRSGALSDVPAKVVVGTDGGVVIAGISNNDAWTVKLAAADGTKLWQQVYNYASKPDAVRGLALDAANNVYIAAYSQATNYDMYTAKYASTDGTLVWGVRYNGSYNSSDAPWDMVVDSDSNVFVTGTSYRSSTLRDGMTLKYAGLDGTLQWQSRFNISSGSDENLSMALDGIGNPVAGGYATNANGTTDVNLFKCNKSSGVNRWQTVFEGGSNKNDTLKRLRCDPNGNVWMTGSAANASGQLQLFIVRHMPSL